MLLGGKCHTPEEWKHNSVLSLLGALDLVNNLKTKRQVDCFGSQRKIILVKLIGIHV